jgi:hypothetical protein
VKLCATAAVTALIARSVAAQQVSMDQVPAEARAAAMYAAGGVKLTDVGLDLDGGQATTVRSSRSSTARVHRTAISTRSPGAALPAIIESRRFTDACGRKL